MVATAEQQAEVWRHDATKEFALRDPTDAEIEAASAAILEAMDITDGLDTESADTYARAAIEKFLQQRRI